MSGGGAMGQVANTAEGASPQTDGASYTPAQAQPTYQQGPATQQVSPLNQQMAAKQNFQNMGLQALYQGMMSNFEQPGQQMPQMQMPTYAQQTQQYNPMPEYGTQRQGSPLAYRPDMTQAAANLNNVVPSVYKSELDAAREQIAQYEAEAEAAARAQAEQDSYFNMG